VSCSGTGGGGTGYGCVYGAGNLDTGGRGTHGKGRGPKLAERGEHEVKLDVAPGNVEEGGGLSKEQINKVVRSHLNAVKFCYEKELQRFPHMAGSVKLAWKVDETIRVSTTRVDSSSLGNPSAEGCMSRQVKNWVFPKSNGPTNVNFPFFFKGQ